MKKLLLMLLMGSILPFGMAYGDDVAANGNADDDFSLTHDVARISVFTVKKLAAVINDGSNIIGTGIKCW